MSYRHKFSSRQKENPRPFERGTLNLFSLARRIIFGFFSLIIFSTWRFPFVVPHGNFHLLWLYFLFLFMSVLASEIFWEFTFCPFSVALIIVLGYLSFDTFSLIHFISRATIIFEKLRFFSFYSGIFVENKCLTDTK